MTEPAETGILYTEHAGLTAMSPILSLWSYETRPYRRDRRSVTLNPDGGHEFWLERWDPLLNTILPGTGVSLVVNKGGSRWAVGPLATASSALPSVCIVGPATRPQVLQVGNDVRALGAVIPTFLTGAVFGVPPSALVDRIVPLQDLWASDDVDRLVDAVSLRDARHGLIDIRNTLIERLRRTPCADTIGLMAHRLISRWAGRVSIDELTKHHGLSRQQFARQFHAATGLTPKLFARIARYQKLVHVLLSTDVSEWASVSAGVGFYDQAHMINEFRTFSGASPTTFFRPHGARIDPVAIRLRGRPSEWPRPGRKAERDPTSA